MKEPARKTLAQAYEREMKQRIGDDLRKTYDTTDWLKLLEGLRKRLSPRQVRLTGRRGCRGRVRN